MAFFRVFLFRNLPSPVYVSGAVRCPGGHRAYARRLFTYAAATSQAEVTSVPGNIDSGRTLCDDIVWESVVPCSARQTVEVSPAEYFVSAGDGGRALSS